MKRMLALLGVIALMAAGAASAFADLEPTRKIGYCVNSDSLGYERVFLREFESFFLAQDGDGLEYELFPVAAGTTVETQEEWVRFLIGQEMDVIVIVPVNMKAVPDLIDLVTEAGIALVIASPEPLSYDLENQSVNMADERITGHDKVIYVCADPRRGGMRQSEAVLELPNRGDVNGDGFVAFAMIEAPSTLTASRIRDSFAAQTLSMGLKNGLCLNKLKAKDTESAGKTACDMLLKQFGYDLDVILCATDTLAAGAAEAIEKAGRKVGEDIYLIGSGGTAAAQEMIREGRMTATVTEEIPSLAWQTVFAAMDVILEDHPSDFYFSDYEIIQY